MPPWLKSLRARRDADLRSLDFLALVLALGLLLALFRQIERWLHQHIFKVGWLLTNSFQTTTILYYILFLPGILLHEFSVWMFAWLLRIRAERAIGFPEQQDIGELRLNFIRVSPQAGDLRYALIRYAPLVAGVVCLWAIAAHIFRWQETASISPLASVDELTRAVNRLTRTADFWLWFYLAFTVANTMFPSLNTQLSARRKSVLLLAFAASVFSLWIVGGAIEISIAQGIEILVGSLILVVLQVIFINLVVVLGLGALESLIERLSGKSAMFADGKMIAMSRQEAQEYSRAKARERLASRKKQPEPARANVIHSVYDLKLPIPGPPGREPVSRRAVSVLKMKHNDVDTSSPTESLADAPITPSRSTVSIEQSALDRIEPGEGSVARRAAPDSQEPASMVRSSPAINVSATHALSDDVAPFTRPFAQASSGQTAAHANLDDDGKQAIDGHFPRPFAMRTRATGQPDVAQPTPADTDLELADDDGGEHQDQDTQPLAYTGRTRPAPKPSGSAGNEVSESLEQAGNELTYEPLDEDDDFAECAEDCDDRLPSS